MDDFDMVKVDGAIATLTIQNPPLNVLTEKSRWEIYRFFETLRHNAAIRVLILRGSGEKAFSVGSDLKDFPLDDTGIGGAEKVAFEQRVYTSLASLPQVTIGALSGYVLGGGAELALACDLRIAGDTLQMGFPEINIGAFSGASGTQRLLRLVGTAKARELMFFGDRISAEEALRLGLVNRVVPQAQLWSETNNWAQKLTEKPWDALQAIKICLDRGADLSFSGGLQVEIEQSSRVYHTEDILEGLAAFKEKRKPNFKHR